MSQIAGLQILALGSNGSGQLSLPHSNDTSVPELCHFHPDLSALGDSEAASRPRSVTKIVAGGNHTALLFDDGIVCIAGNKPAGSNDSNQGEKAPAETTRLFSPTWFDGEDGRSVLRCKDIAATWEATILVSISGHEVYVVGSGSKGELGLGLGITATTRVTRLATKGFPEGITVQTVSACVSHVVIVLSNGECWGWGTSRKGELGKAAATQGKIQWKPKKIEEVGFSAGDCVCGNNSTIIMSSNPAAGSLAILGANKWIADSDKLDYSSARKSTCHLQASWGSLYGLGADGSVKAWGRNDRGQLPPKDLPKIVKLAAGSEHVVSLSADGEVLSWGWGEHGNCGRSCNGSEIAEIVAGRWNVIPIVLQPGWRVVGVSAGCATSFIVVSKYNR